MGAQIPTREGAILRAKGNRPGTCPAVDILKATQQRQQRYGADASRVYILHQVHIGAALRMLLNRLCGGDSIMSNYFDHFLHSLKLCCESIKKLECGPMPNVMAARLNIGGALCESSVVLFLVPYRKVWLTPAAGVLSSNAANIGERKT